MTLQSSIVASFDNPYEHLLEALARTMSVRDEAMNEHAHRVRLYSLALAAATGITDASTVKALDAASLLHDIGKLGVPDRVLHKPGPLTPDEYELVKRHVIIGADLLAGVNFPGPLALFVRHHHENWDGTGYPDHLSGNDIPLGARVLAIADCYDALTSDRPYRHALPHASAVAILAAGRGTMYDPAILDAFLRIIHRLESAPSRVLAENHTLESSTAWLRRARAV